MCEFTNESFYVCNKVVWVHAFSNGMFIFQQTMALLAVFVGNIRTFLQIVNVYYKGDQSAVTQPIKFS